MASGNAAEIARIVHAVGHRPELDRAARVAPGPARDRCLGRGAGVAEVGVDVDPLVGHRRRSSQPSDSAQEPTVRSAPGYAAMGPPEPSPSSVPPLKRITSSSVPWIWRTATGDLGAQSAGVAKVAPARLTIAAIRSAWAQAIR